MGRARSKVLRLDRSGSGHGQVHDFSGGEDDSCGSGHGQVNGWAAFFMPHVVTCPVWARISTYVPL